MSYIEIKYSLEEIIEKTSSEILDDSEINLVEGINPRLLNVDQNYSDLTVIKSGKHDYPRLTLNGKTILEWPDERIIRSSELKNDCDLNPILGINPMLIEAYNSTIDINLIESGIYDFPQLILNGQTIKKWPNEGISKSSKLENDSDVNPTEGINPLLKKILDNEKRILELENKIKCL